MLQECTPLERDEVEDWIQAKPENKQAFKNLLEIWEHSKRIEIEKEIDTEAAWERFKVIRDKKSRAGEKVVSITGLSELKRWIAVAASFITLLGLATGIWLIIKPTENHQKQVAILTLQSGSKTLTDTLPDGSVVMLNKNSWVAYPEVFLDTIRQIKMAGEVFFVVVHNKDKPFVVLTDSTEIRVLGTSFNVKTRKGKTEVIVESGLVEVAGFKQKELVTPGKLAIISSKEATIQIKETQNLLHQYYRSHAFICDNTPLADLAMALSEAFQMQVVPGNQTIADMRITTTFTGNSLPEILTILEETMGVKTQQVADTIFIR